VVRVLVEFALCREALALAVRRARVTTGIPEFGVNRVTIAILSDLDLPSSRRPTAVGRSRILAIPGPENPWLAEATRMLLSARLVADALVGALGV